jgi:hypothetical protein
LGKILSLKSNFEEISLSSDLLTRDFSFQCDLSNLKSFHLDIAITMTDSNLIRIAGLFNHFEKISLNLIGRNFLKNLNKLKVFDISGNLFLSNSKAFLMNPFNPPLETLIIRCECTIFNRESLNSLHKYLLINKN